MPTDGAESVNTPRRGSHGREWEQITGSEGRRNSHQTPRRNRRCLHGREKREANNAGPSISRAPVSKYTSRVIAVSGRRGSAGLRGSGRGLTRWMLPLSQQRITKEHRPSFKLLPAGIHKVFFNNRFRSTPSQPHCEKVLIEDGRARGGGFQHQLCSACISTNRLSWLGSWLSVWRVNQILHLFCSSKLSVSLLNEPTTH